MNDKNKSTPVESKANNLPFPKRWLWYIGIKIVVLVAIAFGVLKWKGLL